jgi:hypothetical protein
MDRVDLLGESGAVYTVELRGVKYRMSRLIARLKAEWELYLRTRYLNLLAEMRAALPPEEYLRELAEFKAKRDAGYFALDGEHSREQIATREGQLFLVGLAFRRYHPEMTDETLFDLLVYRGDEIAVGFQALHGPDLERAAQLAGANGADGAAGGVAKKTPAPP